MKKTSATATILLATIQLAACTALLVNLSDWTVAWKYVLGSTVLAFAIEGIKHLASHPS